MKKYKYIRTKDDRVIENKCGKHQGWLCGAPCTEEKYWCTNKGEIWQSNILKQADTMEELCDETICVFNNKHFKVNILRDPCGHLYAECRTKCHKLETVLKKGALHMGIWTKGGLKFIARMTNILPGGEIEWGEEHYE